MNYQKDKEYNLKYITDKGETKEVSITPEQNMNKPQMISKLKSENKDFFKLLEGKLFGKPITTYKVSFYVDDDETPYDEILEKTENALKNTGLASYIDKIEIEEYKVMDESKELLTEDTGDFIISGKGFWIGDPCYVLSDERYDKWGDKYGYSDGLINIDDDKFIVHGTAYGDGEYFDDNGYSYGVDSGTIAVIPLELVKQDIEGINEGDFEYGRVVFGSKANLDYEDGVIVVKIDNDTEVRVDTDPEEDEWDEDDDIDSYYEDDDEEDED